LAQLSLSSHATVSTVTAFSFRVMYRHIISKEAVPQWDGFRSFGSLKIS
jgi:hypothetical protein